MRHSRGDVIPVLLMLVACLMLAGCDATYSTSRKSANNNVAIIQAQCESGASNAFGGSPYGGTITLDDIRKCSTREEYLQLVMPAYAADCNSLGIGFPGVLALQGVYETGMPTNIAYSAEADNNLGGLKYSSSIPNATEGTTSSEGDSYAHFDSVSDYIYAQCWQVSTDTYAKVRQQNNVSSFTRVLCHIWVKGDVSGASATPCAYSEDIISDYSRYGLSSYENGGGGSVIGASSASSPSSSSATSNLKIVSHHQWEADDRFDPTDDFPLESYASTKSHDGKLGDASKADIDTSLQNDEKGGHGSLQDVKYIVLHSTESNTDDATNIINSWNTATGDRDGVGAHFIVDKQGHIYQWVSTSLVAWHAGKHEGSLYDFSDITDGSMNSHSIGIEIVHDQGTGAYPEAQLEAVDNLIAWIQENVHGGKASSDGSKTGKCDGIGNASSSSSAVTASGDMSGIVAYARTMLGLAYETPGTWDVEGTSTDCSGLICRCYKYGGNIDLTTLGDNIRTADSMKTSGHFQDVDESDLQPGDIICFTAAGASTAHHVALYVGDGNMIHEANSTKGCILTSLSTYKQYSSDTMTYRRFVG